MRHRWHPRQGPGRGQLVDALKRLEYRGYDSAGVATVENGMLGAPPRRGQAAQSRSAAQDAPLLGKTGIGHTRWATHGSRPRPTPIRT